MPWRCTLFHKFLTGHAGGAIGYCSQRECLRCLSGERLTRTRLLIDARSGELAANSELDRPPCYFADYWEHFRSIVGQPKSWRNQRDGKREYRAETGR